MNIDNQYITNQYDPNQLHLGPYTNYGVSPIRMKPGVMSMDMAQEIEVYQAKAQIDATAQVEVARAKGQIDADNERLKAELDERRMAALDDLDLRKRAETFELYRNQEGVLQMIVRRPAKGRFKEKVVPTDVLTAGNLRVFSLLVRGEKEVLPKCVCMTWPDSGSNVRRLYLAGDNINEETFWRQLAVHGVSLKTTERNRSAVKSMLFAFLMNEAVKTPFYLPRTSGWVKKPDNPGCWIFVDSETLTFMDALEMGGVFDE